MFAVPIGSIREVRCVHTSEVQGLNPTGIASIAMVAPSPDWTFSIIHGDDFCSLDLIATSAEEATIWVTGLNALIGAQLCKWPVHSHPCLILLLLLIHLHSSFRT